MWSFEYAKLELKGQLTNPIAWMLVILVGIAYAYTDSILVIVLFVLAVIVYYAVGLSAKTTMTSEEFDKQTSTRWATHELPDRRKRFISQASSTFNTKPEKYALALELFDFETNPMPVKGEEGDQESLNHKMWSAHAFMTEAQELDFFHAIISMVIFTDTTSNPAGNSGGMFELVDDKKNNSMIQDIFEYVSKSPHLVNIKQRVFAAKASHDRSNPGSLRVPAKVFEDTPLYQHVKNACGDQIKERYVT